MAEAISSVLAQTYSDWELILVDDGSTDMSVKIALSFANQYEKISFIQHPNNANCGMSASRNLGLAIATGKYVCFLDGDDIWFPNKLKEQVDILQTYPTIGMVYGKTMLWNSWDENTSIEDGYAQLGAGVDKIWQFPKLLPRLLDLKCQTPTTCNAIFTKECIEYVGGFDNSFRDLYEDQVVFLKVLATHDTFISSKVWAKYRQRPTSTFNSSARSETDRIQRKKLLKSFQEYVNFNAIQLPLGGKLMFIKAMLRCSNPINWYVYLKLQTYVPKLSARFILMLKYLRRLYGKV